MKVKFIILPHAGGASHSYQKLAQALSPRFEIYCHDLPGHGRRASEPLMDNMEALSYDLLQKLSLLDKQPWAVLGHSMGATLAHSLLQARKFRGLSLPVAFFASGTPSPSAKVPQRISHLPSDVFWSKIRGFGGVSDEILKTSEFREGPRGRC